MMPMLIDAGKRLLIDAGERVPRVNQDENSLSVVEDNCVTRDDVFGHVLYAVAFDLDEHCGMSLASNEAKPPPRDNQDENVAARLMMPMLIDAGERCLPAARQSVRSIA
jgi:hypothetical protein